MRTGKCPPCKAMIILVEAADWHDASSNAASVAYVDGQWDPPCSVQQLLCVYCGSLTEIYRLIEKQRRYTGNGWNCYCRIKTQPALIEAVLLITLLYAVGHIILLFVQTLQDIKPPAFDSDVLRNSDR